MSNRFHWSMHINMTEKNEFLTISSFMSLQRGYPGAADECNRSTIYGPAFFPTLTHTLILKDTWVLIVEQMHELGLDTFLKLFRLSANLR